MNSPFMSRTVHVSILMILVLCASLFLASPAGAANGSFGWAKSMGGIDSDSGIHIEVDADGNIYTTGRFENTVDFDPGPGLYNLTSAGGFDIFILKLDADGNFVWARGMGGSSWDQGTRLAVDASGNVYTTGHFASTADFDPGADTYNLTSAGLSDIFVSKLDADGNFVWARGMGGPGTDRAEDLALNAAGDVYTIGHFERTADFDPGPGIADLTSAGYYDIFASKLDSNGNLVWAKGIGGVGSDEGWGLAVDANGSVYMTGYFEDSIDFDPGVGIATLVSAGLEDIFVLKLDSSGSFVWARSVEGTDRDFGVHLALDTSGNGYIAGFFSGTADFDPGPGIANLTSAGSIDIFVSKLDSNGGFVWAKRMGGAGDDRSYSLALATSGKLYTTGFFEGTADFDPGAATVNLTSAGNRDIFIAELQEGAIFADVPLGYWALDYIEQLYGVGITGGCATSPLRYCPEDTVTRAQMAVFLLRGIHGADYVPPEVAGTTGFADVPADHWAAAFIKQLAAEGITSGCGGGNFCPENPVTRAQMAVFLLRSKYGASYHPPAVGSSTGFTDVPADYWAAAFIKQLVAEGITVGCGGGNYCPEQPVIRAQMAVFLVRTFNLP